MDSTVLRSIAGGFRRIIPLLTAGILCLLSCSFKSVRKRYMKDDKGMINFVLLDANEWDASQYVSDLAKEWDIVIPEDAVTDSVIYTDIDGFRVSLFLIPQPIPEEEVVTNAKLNYMWDNAVAVALMHQAQLVVAVMDKGKGKGKINRNKQIEAAKLLTKLTDAALKQKHATAVAGAGTVIDPKIYTMVAQSIRENELPIFDWVWFGVYPTEKEPIVYTFGMFQFGHQDIEVIGTPDNNLQEMLDYLTSVAGYILDTGATIRPGDIVDGPDGTPLRVTEKDGVAYDKKVLGIRLPGKTASDDSTPEKKQ